MSLLPLRIPFSDVVSVSNSTSTRVENYAWVQKEPLRRRKENVEHDEGITQDDRTPILETATTIGVLPNTGLQTATTALYLGN